MFTVAFATPLPDARSVAGWIDGSDRPSCREAARARPLCSLSPDLPDRENPAQILVELVPQWPGVVLGPDVFGVVCSDGLAVEVEEAAVLSEVGFESEHDRRSIPG